MSQGRKLFNKAGQQQR